MAGSLKTRRPARRKRPTTTASASAAPSEPPADWPRQGLLASVDFYERDIVLTRTMAAGDERRVIGMAELRRLLSGVDRAGRGSGTWLAAGDGVIALGYADGEWRYLVRRPAGEAKLIFETVRGKKARRRTIRFHCPALLAELTGTPRRRGGIAWRAVERVYAVPDGPLTGRTVLRACPTPNVQGGHAHMCAVNMAAVAGLRPLAAFERAFFGSAFTEMIADCLTPAAARKHGNCLRLARTKGRIGLQVLRKEGALGSRYPIA